MGSKHARALVGLCLAAAATFSGTLPAFAQEQSTNRVAAKTDWSVFVEDEPKECWGVSAPKETVNTRDGRVVAVRRGDILLFVFYRPAAGVTGQVTFTGGYPFATGSTVNLKIGDDEFELFTEGEWAWPASESDDAKIIAAMKRGADAVLTARSSRGTQTQDTFSLLGFTAAVEDAEARCK
ncbi:invasion associated locus B family protein [Pseudodonghicola flavimaris]|uniref:Invasion associated locus B family protein n=1 Tax=Pseudodonghicola flavimaris TaxID=3050036 RepID=A0ABT7EZB1_9RHOB|nr:invasion associated locus B family protein [Pseudodonghicola flavimaris]MDK3017685.1 invasion associated locus B family protein [Pseudodonghicola flavimaris]